MALKFYTDTHIDKQVAIQLRNRDVDIVRCEEVGLAEADDETYLEYATAHNCVMITKDDDFIKLHVQWNHENKKHSGIFFCPYRDQPMIGLIMETCFYYFEAIQAGAGSIQEDIENQIRYIT